MRYIMKRQKTADPNNLETVTMLLSNILGRIQISQICTSSLLNHIFKMFKNTVNNLTGKDTKQLKGLLKKNTQ